MAFKREYVMFRADASAPDPDQEKFRFRRRVLFLCVMGVIVLLAIPVFKDRLPALNAHKEAKLFIQKLYEAKLVSQKSGHAFHFSLDRQNFSQWTFSQSKADCKGPEIESTKEVFLTENFSWRIVAHSNTGENTIDVQTLCFDPRMGLFGDGVLVAADREITILIGPQDDRANGRQDRVLQFMLAQSGDFISPVLQAKN
jgi:hypothetical protein